MYVVYTMHWPYKQQSLLHDVGKVFHALTYVLTKTFDMLPHTNSTMQYSSCTHNNAHNKPIKDVLTQLFHVMSGIFKFYLNSMFH